MNPYPWIIKGLAEIQQKNYLGEVLYLKLHELVKQDAELQEWKITAGYLTGMILSLSVKELDVIVRDDALIVENFTKAKEVLRSMKEK